MARDETIRARVRAELRQRLEAIAAERDLDLSDILREAVNQYLARQPAPLKQEGEHPEADTRHQRRSNAA